MKNVTIFLSGDYKQSNLKFCKTISQSRFLVAANGGHKFFLKAGVDPHLVIGDLDSMPNAARRKLERCALIQVPAEKNQTDGELALVYCLGGGARSIDIVDLGCGEIDHKLGNLFLLELAHNLAPACSVRLLGLHHEVRLVADSSWTIQGRAGDIVSVIPISRRIRLTSAGTIYRAHELLLRRGQTLGLRNQIERSRARIEVEGKAFVVHGLAL